MTEKYIYSDNPHSNNVVDGNSKPITRDECIEIIFEILGKGSKDLPKTGDSIPLYCGDIMDLNPIFKNDGSVEYYLPPHLANENKWTRLFNMVYKSKPDWKKWSEI